MRPLAWFEIPATDLERAVRFYEALLAVTMETGTMGPSRMAVFPFDKASTIGGCVMTAPGFRDRKSVV